MKVLTFILIFAAFCGGGRIKVTEATSQEWVGGLQESGYGTDYQMIIKAKAGSEQFQIDELWVGDLHMKVRVIADPAKPMDRTFKKGARLVVKAGMTLRPGPDEKGQLLSADSLARPVDFRGEGLLGYTWKGEKRYAEIDVFKKLERIIYP